MSTETATKEKSKNTGYYINVTIMFLLMFGIGQIEPFGQITPLGMQILGIFVGMLYGWCTVNLIWPSLLGMLVLGCTEYCTVNEVFDRGFGDDLCITIAAICVLTAFLDECGFSRYLGNWFISRKIGEGRPWIFTCLIFAAAYVMAALTSIYAATFLLWGIFYKICETIGVKKRSKYASFVLAGIIMIGTITKLIFPFRPFALMLVNLAGKGAGAPLEINYLTWMAFQFIITVAIIGGLMLIAKFIVRPDMTKVKEAGKIYAYLRDEKMNRDQKIGAIALLFFFVAVVLPGVVPKTFPGYAWLNVMGVKGFAVLSVVLVMMFRRKDGKYRCNIAKLVGSGVNWELIILLAATFPLCDAMESEQCGVLPTVMDWLTTTFSSLSPMMFMVGFVALFLITTQVTHNLVLMLVFTPVLTDMGMTFGINPALILVLVFYTAMAAFLTPAASSNAALVFVNREWIDTKWAYFWGGQ